MFVDEPLRAALCTGLVLRSAGARIEAGTVVVTGAGVAHVLEVDERAALTAVWTSLVGRDAVRLERSLRAFGEVTPTLAGAAHRAVLSLEVHWTPIAVGLSFYVVAGAVRHRRGAEPIVDLAAELLRRLDLAHEHRIEPWTLGDPRSATGLAHAG